MIPKFQQLRLYSHAATVYRKNARTSLCAACETKKEHEKRLNADFETLRSIPEWLQT